ncbi:MAG: nitrogen fixation protein NifZ [Candidatus Competibacteraceae bacterium]|jgi:nitrogen fixation protein NifZ|nr:nitrogen fixation protein NifZ [Candidatus Competibacteraceae bacterium]
MRPQFDYGAEVRVTRNIRNDGTYPGLSRGDLLVRRGSTGLVRDIGRFLQDQVIYAVLFQHDESRLVGCREQELIPVDAPWVPNQFEFHEWVRTRIPLAVAGRVVMPAEQSGQIEKVLRDQPGGVQYHVRFAEERVLQVPESVLESASDDAF